MSYIFNLELIADRLAMLGMDAFVSWSAEFVSIGLPSLCEGQQNALDCSGATLPMVFNCGRNNNTLEVRLFWHPRKMLFLLPEDMPLVNVTLQGGDMLGEEGAFTDGLSCWMFMGNKAESQGIRTLRDGPLSGTVTRVMDAIFLESEHSKARWVLIRSS